MRPLSFQRGQRSRPFRLRHGLRPPLWRRIGVSGFRVRCLGVVKFDDNALE